MSFPNLHDAVLLDIKVCWKKAVVEISFNTSESEKLIRAEDFKILTCPRALPWGPSVHVNGITHRASQNTESIEIEMQSGDAILIEARSISLFDAPQNRAGH
jgi:hypothetical protein